MTENRSPSSAWVVSACEEQAEDGGVDECGSGQVEDHVSSVREHPLQGDSQVLAGGKIMLAFHRQDRNRRAEWVGDEARLSHTRPLSVGGVESASSAPPERRAAA